MTYIVVLVGGSVVGRSNVFFALDHPYLCGINSSLILLGEGQCGERLMSLFSSSKYSQTVWTVFCCGFPEYFEHTLRLVKVL